jgi:cellulose synthase/poly-beta-1,6-N-acetylglucosamine synthase-like glycosyltransferase
MSGLFWQVVDLFNVIVLAYFFSLNVIYLILSLLAFRFLARYVRRLKSIDVDELVGLGAAPPITIISPAFNEAETVVEATRALTTLHYPEYEVLLVNDGSTDGTLEVLHEAFDLVPAARMPSAELPVSLVKSIYRSRLHRDLWVIDKVNGGKSDALNTGLIFCRTPLFCVIDADSIVDGEALMRAARPFLEDTRTVAAGGIIRVANGSSVKSGSVKEVRLPRNLLAKFQVLEYLRAYLSGRVGWAQMNATLIISGAFGVFRRSAVVEAGGYATNTVGEDMELVIRLHRHFRDRKIPYRIVCIPDPVAWTECPETLRGMARQRDRWQRGLVQTMIRHRGMLFNPRYGTVGMFAIPYFFILEMVGPLIEVGGYLFFGLTVAAGRASPVYVVAFLVLAVVFGIALSSAAVAQEELSFRRYAHNSDLLQLIVLALAENVFYRQLTSFWRLNGVVNALRGRNTWGTAERRGFRVQEAA